MIIMLNCDPHIHVTSLCVFVCMKESGQIFLKSKLCLKANYFIYSYILHIFFAFDWKEQEMPFWHEKSAKKGPQKYLLSRPNLISVILRMDVPLIRKTCVSVFLRRNLGWLLLKEIQIVTESVKIKKACGFWKMFEMKLRFSKVSSMRSKALFYVSPNQQHGWPLRPHHSICVTN